MSLIEAALRKLQETTPGSPARGRSPVPKVVGALMSAPEDVVQSARRIEIDRDALRRAGLLLTDAQSRPLSNQYRHIKRPLLAAALGRGGDLPLGHLIMVASALPGEGKSFTTMNLALSLALEKDTSVLLVDADVAKPDISRAFGVQGEPGLIDALQEPDRDVESYVIPTNFSGLSVLPAGRHVETATELLASDRMKLVVKRLGDVDGRRIVVFDSPPLLLTNESCVLSDVVGQVVVVVRAGVTTRQVLADALSRLAEGKAVSLILNQSTGEGTGNNYGYPQYGQE